MSDVQVIGLPQSNFVWAVRIALAEKGVPHENIPAAPHSAEVAAAHPLGKVPVLRHGAVEFGESRAIIDYVDAVFDGPGLVPEGLDARILSGVWTSIVTTTIEPLLVRQHLFAYFFPKGPGGQPDREAIAALLPEVGAKLDLLEGAIAKGEIGAAPFGRVDAFLVPILFYFRNTPDGLAMLAARPLLASYLERSLSRSSVQSTMPPPPGQP